METKPNSFQRAPLIDGIDHVLATAGLIAAVRSKKRGERQLINADREDEDLFQHA